MTKPEASPAQSEGNDGLLEDGWGSLDGGEGDFASEHTTVDPALLDRLAALDEKKKKNKKAKAASKVPDAAGLKMPEKRERTINLDISDLLAMELESNDETPILEDEDSPRSDAPEVPIQAMAGPRAGDSAVKNSDVSNPNQPSVQLDNAVAEDVDPEFAAEKTQIFIPAMDDEPTRAKLRLVQGGGQQKEYLLARDRVTIGRGTNNDILVPDIAISRQHCEITRQPEGTFRVGDLSSGNGTKLNGNRIIDSDLFGGDRIEIGNTILEFVITGPGASRSPGERRINPHPSEAPASPNRRTSANPAVVPQPAPAPAAPVPNYASGGGGNNATMTHFQLQQVQAAPAAGRSTGLMLTALIALFGLLFLSLAVVIGAKIYLDFQSSQSSQVNNKPASAYFFEGAEHVKSKDWDKAEEKFTIAADLAREEREFQIRKDAELQLERVRAEKSNQKAFNRGRSLYEKGDYPEAISKLGAVRSGSVYDDEAKEMLGQAKEKFAGELVEQARTHFEAKQYDEADKKIVMALRTRPGFIPAKNLRKKIDNLSEDDYQRPKTFAANDPRKPPRRGADTPRKGGSGRPPAAVATGDKPDKGSKPDKKGGADPAGKPDKKGSTEIANFAPGLSMYRSKRYNEAISYFNQIASDSEDDFSRNRAGKLAKNVASFERSYQSGNSAYASSSWSSAAKQLEAAYRLDKSISGTGVHGPELREKLAESNYQLARSAFGGQNFQRAGIHAKKVKGYKPNHSGNLQLLGQLESKGKSMYIDALNKRDKDPTQARRIAKAITNMLPASSETHKKAKQLLSSL